MASAPKTQDPAPPQRWRRELLEGATAEWLPVACATLLVVGLAASYFLAAALFDWQFARVSRTETRRLAVGISAALGDAGEADAQAALEQIAGHLPDVTGAAWLGNDGAVLAAWPTAATASAPVASGRVLETVPVRGKDAAPRGTLRLECTASGRAPIGLALVQAWSLVGGVVLLVFATYYGLERRRLRPITAIDRMLRQHLQSPDLSPASFILSESLGDTARAWNRLIGELADARKGKSGRSDTSAAHSALQRFESARYRQLIDRLPFGVILIDEQKIAYANGAAATLLRASSALDGAAFDEAIQHAAVGQAVLAARTRPGSRHTADVMLGDEKTGETALRFHALVPAPQVGASQVLLTVEDVSAIRESQRARDNFLYHVAHELRTPLTNIHAYTETLSGPGFDDERTRKECYNVLISETERLSRLIEDILNLSQIEVGTARLDLSEVDFVRLVRQMVQDNLGAADEKHIDLNLALPPKLPKVSGDKQRLAVLLNNLIGNAIKYTPENGKVQVCVEVAERRVRVAVTDTGIGIAPTEQARVFEKFYRSEDDRVRTVKGTGLGLAIAQEVARLHGGEITLESELGKGSTFTVELPCLETNVMEAPTR